VAQHVAALADGADHLGGHRVGGAQAREVTDFVIRAVERGPDERVHARLQPDEARLLGLLLQLRDAGQEHARVGDEEASRLHPQLGVGMRVFERFEPVGDVVQVERAALGVLGHAQAAAHVEEARVGEIVLRLRRQKGGRLGPRLRRRHDAAADVGVQSHDARAGLVDQRPRPLQVRRGDAELRLRAGGAHVLVVAASLPGVEAQNHVPPGEDLRPRPEWVQVVERQVHPVAFGREGVLRARGEVGGKEDAPRRQLRQDALDVAHLAGRDAFEAQPGFFEKAEHTGMRIRLHGVEKAVGRVDLFEAADGGAQRFLVVDVDGRVLLIGERQQVVPAVAPPRPLARRLRRPPQQVLPRRAEGRPLHRRRGRAEELGVQLAGEALGLLFVHHEAEVQVAGRLRDEVGVLLFEDPQRRPQFMQNSADAPPHEAHLRARPNARGLAVGFEVAHERVERAVGERLRGGVERHGHFRLGGRHQIHRQPVALEDAEHVAEKSRLLPHPERLHRDEHDAALGGDGLDLRAGVGRLVGDDGVLDVGIGRAADV